MASVTSGFLQGRKCTRSSIFSGSSRISTNVPSLKSLAQTIVGRNILYYRHLPAECFDTLRPILFKLTVAQLRQFLAVNLDLIQDCDLLYKGHCIADFKQPPNVSFDTLKAKLAKSKFGQAYPELFRKQLCSWSRSYELLEAEQEYRLKLINDSIQRNNRKVKQNERKTVVIDASHRSRPTFPTGIGAGSYHRTSMSNFAGNGLTNSKRPSMVSIVPASKPKPAPLMRKCLDIKKRYNSLLK